MLCCRHPHWYGHTTTSLPSLMQFVLLFLTFNSMLIKMKYYFVKRSFKWLKSPRGTKKDFCLFSFYEFLWILFMYLFIYKILQLHCSCNDSFPLQTFKSLLCMQGIQQKYLSNCMFKCEPATSLVKLYTCKVACSNVALQLLLSDYIYPL